jgi:hypothetical protein
MKFIYTSILMCFSCLTLNAQTQHPLISKLITDLETDSLLMHVNDLSGEKSCVINGKTTTIKNRVSKTGNDPAADYLKERMQSYGFTVNDQKYSTGGRNIIAEQTGALYPDKKYIICAHYDAVADYCADDDISSCSAILEIARLLSKHKFKYTIVYAFWDEEEVGMVGSTYYAKLVKKNNENIMGVINVEMLGYDSNKDSKMDIHTKASSLTLSNKLVELNSTYNFTLKTNVINPGTDRSDHGSFWTQGYSAICFGEAFFSGDDNPSYHTSNDRLKLFNLPYYFELSRLSLAAIATFAEPYDVTGINTVDEQHKIKLDTYPNPVKDALTICYDLPEKATVQMNLYSIINGVYENLLNETQNAGTYQFVVNTAKLASGVYVITVKTASQAFSKKIVLEK